MWGLNVFYDENFHFNHKRLGLGGEFFTPCVTVRANYYDALSGKQQVGVSTYERALDGGDLGIETPIPYVPWMRFTAQGYHWSGVDASNVNGGIAGLRIFPARQLEVDAGVAYDNSQHAQGYLAAYFYLDKPAFIEYSATNTLPKISKTPFATKNLENMRLQKVIRHNDITVEKTNGAGASGAIIIARGT